MTETKTLPYAVRFSSALELICQAKPPAKMVAEWISGENEKLQDWVGTTSSPWWLQNIGAIEAAHEAATHPIEGDDRIDYES